MVSVYEYVRYLCDTIIYTVYRFCSGILYYCCCWYTVYNDDESNMIKILFPINKRIHWTWLFDTHELC
jgi:hypothetical protein